MARTEECILTNMCMIHDGSRVLVQNRVSKTWPGLTFPGGHVEKGEAFTDSVIREVFEETGLTISAPQLCGVKDWCNSDGTRYIVLLYKACRFEGTLAASDEGDVFWMELEQMKQAQLAEDMEKTLKVFLQDDLSEHFSQLEDGRWIEMLK